MAAKATAIFDADDSRLQQAVARIDRNLLAIQAKFARIGMGIGVALGGAAVAAGVFGAGIKSALDEAGRLNDLSQNTGVAVEDLAVLTQEFKNAGKAGEDVGKVFAKMQKTLADGSANDVIRDLGIDLEELQDMAPLDQFRRLGTAIAALKSPTERAAAAQALFGKSGSTMLAMFSSKGFGEASAQVGDQARILGENAALFDDASDKLALAGLKTQGFFVGVAERVVPVLKPLLDDFAKIDLAAKGQLVGDAISVGLLAVATGDIWPMMGKALMISMGEAINFLLSGLLTVIGEISAVMLDQFRAVMDFLFSRLLELLSLAEKVPGVKGMVSAGREGLAQTAAAAQATAVALRGIGQHGALIDTAGLSAELSALVGNALSQSHALGLVARALNPTKPPEAGVADLAAGNSPNLSALGRVGGAFGAGGGSDPLIEANRQRETANGYLREILTALTGDRPGSTAMATGFYG